MCANHDDDFDAIVDSIKLGFLFCWSIVVLNRHVFTRQPWSTAWMVNSAPIRGLHSRCEKVFAKGLHMAR